MINVEKLEEGLSNLRGYDMIALEKEERLAGNTALELSTSKGFQARVAAKALGVNPHDLLELPLRTFNQVCVRTFAFLNAPDEPPT